MKKQDTKQPYIYYPYAVTSTFTRRLFAADAILDEVCDEHGRIIHYLCDPRKYEAVKREMMKEARS